MLKFEGEYLNRLQNISKIIAVLSFAVFVVLIVFGAYQLSRVNKQINSAESKLAEKNNEISDREAKIRELDAVLTNKETQLKTRDSTLREVVKDLKKEEIDKAFENKSVARIYLHIGDESERKNAEKIAETLQLGGYIVPKIENVGHNASKFTQLRYCQDKWQQDDLNKIKELLARDGRKLGQDRELTMASCAKVTPRVYELWIESSAANQKKEDKPSIETKKPVIETKKLY